MLDIFIDRWPAVLIVAVLAYLLGSVNWAIIITKALTRKDIRDVGSGNAGATNVLRSQGVLPAVLTLLGDAGKGVLAALLGGWLVCCLPVGTETFDMAALTLFGRYMAGTFAVLGHLFPVFYGFRGGKGVATIAGLLFVTDWRIGLLCVCVFAVVVAIWRMVSLGSVTAGVCIILSTFLFRLYVDGAAWDVVWFCTLTIGVPVAMAIAKHSSNIRRIIAGTESRIGEKTATPSVESIEEK